MSIQLRKLNLYICEKGNRRKHITQWRCAHVFYTVYNRTQKVELVTYSALLVDLCHSDLLAQVLVALM